MNVITKEDPRWMNCGHPINWVTFELGVWNFSRCWHFNVYPFYSTSQFELKIFSYPWFGSVCYHPYLLNAQFFDGFYRLTLLFFTWISMVLCFMLYLISTLLNSDRIFYPKWPIINRTYIPSKEKGTKHFDWHSKETLINKGLPWLT